MTIFLLVFHFFPGQCFSININQCVNRTTYQQAILPNALGHTKLAEVSVSAEENQEIFENHCYGYAKDFWCSVYNPECKNGRAELPCRDYCLGNERD